ncbi:transcriptional regulator [Bacillus sp. AFS015802]|uniref:helix-turn-helix transcriptional regulator n=1 Tax=Bacillus sp. AFS015802 TaxID=2033486 RepID=UPI000BF6F4D7|nr:helix-turn-helix transcriptional regulator [Bacillus sp. AFS015802]PFA66865.1 transcriptional regulator [Bacillus sp. AFS015802]
MALKEMRKENELTPSELAIRAQISLGHLKKIEKGERDLSLKLAARIAKVLGCSIKDLY